MHGYSLLRTQLNNDYFHELFDASAEFGVAIEGHRTGLTLFDCSLCCANQLLIDTETGPGVLETALAYTSALQMADSAILFKYIAKSVGMKHGIIPSFMAKPWGKLPGCSGFVPSSTLGLGQCSNLTFSIRHVHVSLRDKSGRNIFTVADSELKEGRSDAAFEDTKFVSQKAEWFLAGILDGIADGMLQTWLSPAPLTAYSTVMPMVKFRF